MRPQIRLRPSPPRRRRAGRSACDMGSDVTIDRGLAFSRRNLTWSHGYRNNAAGEGLGAGSAAPPSWPGVSRPSALRRRGGDGRDTPGHEGRKTTLLRRLSYPDGHGAWPGGPGLCRTRHRQSWMAGPGPIGAHLAAVVALPSWWAKHVPGEGRGAHHPRLLPPPALSGVDAGP